MSGDNGNQIEEDGDGLDSFYKRKIYDYSGNERSVWEGQRKDIFKLLECEPKEGTVFGWCLYEILSSISGTGNLLVDDGVRQLLFSHIIQLQHLFFYKLERKHLLETRPIAIFVAKTLSHGLFSTSCVSMLDVLAHQKLGFLPLLLMHVEADEVYNFFDALIIRHKPPGFMLSIASALCGEVKFHSTRTFQKLPLERLFALLITLFEDMKEYEEVWKEIAPVIDPLAEFIVNTMVAQHDFRRYSRSVDSSVPNFMKELSRQTHQLVSTIKSDNKCTGKNGEHKPQRNIQLKMLDLVMALIRTQDPTILKTMELYQHVELICEALFNQVECPMFFTMGVSFIQCVLATRRTALITPKLIESIVNIFNMNDIRRVYIEAAIREIYPLPAYNQHFPSEVVEMMSTSRALGTSIIGLTQAEKLQKRIDSLTRYIQLTNEMDAESEDAIRISQLNSTAPVAPTTIAPVTTIAPATLTPATLTPATLTPTIIIPPLASPSSPTNTTTVQATPTPIITIPSLVHPMSPDFPMSPTYVEREHHTTSNTSSSSLTLPVNLLRSSSPPQPFRSSSPMPTSFTSPLSSSSSPTSLPPPSSSSSPIDPKTSKSHQKHHNTSDKRDKEKEKEKKEKERQKEKQTKNSLKKKALASAYAAYAQTNNTGTKNSS